MRSWASCGRTAATSPTPWTSSEVRHQRARVQLGWRCVLTGALLRRAEQADEIGKMTCELDKLILLNYEARCLRACAHALLRCARAACPQRLRFAHEP